MTADDFRVQLEAWCEDLKGEAARLFETGAHPAECTDLAVRIVESRRRKTLADRARLTPALLGRPQN